MRCIPKASARWATSPPIRPRPTMPSVLPWSSTPSHFDRRQFPALRSASAWGTLRAWEISSARACSAAERMFDWGALTTMTPLRVAAATSTLSRPIPARPTTTRSVPASRTSLVTWVALRMTSAEAPRTAPSRSSGDSPTATSTSKPAAASVSRPTWASGSVTSTREATGVKANRPGPPTPLRRRLALEAMPRRPMIAPVWALLCLMLVVTAAGPAAAQSPPGPPYQAKAWILVDAGTGRVLDAYTQHEALPPASTTKLMTALVATEKLAPEAIVTVSPVAAAQPAMRIGMVAGQQWTLDAAMHSLMMVSANDAAYALAEAASGSLAAFADDMNAAALRYGMVDSHFADPAGFDDAAAFGGGNRVSAYDLAIAARNVLAVPGLMAMVGTTKWTF